MAEDIPGENGVISYDHTRKDRLRDYSTAAFAVCGARHLTSLATEGEGPTVQLGTYEIEFAPMIFTIFVMDAIGGINDIGFNGLTGVEGIIWVRRSQAGTTS